MHMFSGRVLCGFTYLVDCGHLLMIKMLCRDIFFLKFTTFQCGPHWLKYYIGYLSNFESRRWVMVASLPPSRQDLGLNLNLKDVLTRGAVDTPKTEIGHDHHSTSIAVHISQILSPFHRKVTRNVPLIYNEWVSSSLRTPCLNSIFYLPLGCCIPPSFTLRDFESNVISSESRLLSVFFSRAFWYDKTNYCFTWLHLINPYLYLLS
jgi:hypothetical protein